MLSKIKSSFFGKITLPFIPSDELQAIIDRADIEGFKKPKTSVMRAMDLLIQESIDNGSWWSGLDHFANYAYNDIECSQFSLINWVNPMGDLQVVNGGLIYTVNGWEGDGINGYIITNFNPSSDGINYQLNNAGRGASIYKQATSGLGEIMSIDGASSRQTMYNSDRTDQRINCFSASLNASADLSGLGLKSMYRDDSSNVRLYNNDVELSRTQNSSASQYDFNYALFSRAQSVYSDLGMSCVFYSKAFTSVENEEFRNIYNNYLTTIGLTPQE